MEFRGEGRESMQTTLRTETLGFHKAGQIGKNTIIKQKYEIKHSGSF